MLVEAGGTEQQQVSVSERSRSEGKLKLFEDFIFYFIVWRFVCLDGGGGGSHTTPSLKLHTFRETFTLTEPC